ncbi:MAG: FAD-binding oxidoreductase [Candidatus Dormibacteraceae bacterium]
MIDQPIWQRPAERGPGKLPGKVEVLVVGGGITGVSLLRRLGERGLSAALVERRHLAFGASGRNAGFLLEGTAANYAEAVRRHGATVAAEVWAYTAENHRRLADALGGRAAYRRSGSRTLAASPAEAIQLQEAAELMNRGGWPVGFSEGAILNPRDGEVDPAAVVDVLASESREGSIHEGVDVRSLDELPVLAETVILATNAFLPELVPSLPIAPTRAQMLATAPHPRRIVAGPTYADHGYQYWRQLMDGRMLVGGYRDRAVAEEVGYELTTTDLIQGHLDAHLRGLGVEAEVTHRWAGTMGFTPDSLPIVGALPGRPGVHVCGGFNGHGMAFAHICARTLVDHLLGGPPPPIWLSPERFAKLPS